MSIDYDVLSVEDKGTYDLRTVLWHDIGGAGERVQGVLAFTKAGHLIGDHKDAERLVDERGIAPDLADPSHNVCSIGFCDREQQWYGWSHRAIYGFGVGSVVEKGHIGYVPATIDELAEKYQWIADQDGTIERLPDRIRISTPMVRYRQEDPETGQLSDPVPTDPDVWERFLGRGEWTAETLEDAKRMAIDFAAEVS